MKPLEIALRYMEVFFSGGQVEALRPLMADDFRFEGPFYTYDSADAYLDALKEDPPEGFAYEVRHAFENDASACLVFTFSKPGIQTPMAQVFEIEHDRISKIILIFDTGAFADRALSG